MNGLKQIGDLLKQHVSLNSKKTQQKDIDNQQVKLYNCKDIKLPERNFNSFRKLSQSYAICN